MPISAFRFQLRRPASGTQSPTLHMLPAIALAAAAGLSLTAFDGTRAWADALLLVDVDPRHGHQRAEFHLSMVPGVSHQANDDLCDAQGGARSPEQSRQRVYGVARCGATGRSRQSHWPPRSLAGRDPRCVRAAEAPTKAYDGLHLTNAPHTAGATRSPTLCSLFCESS
jgi:hypothetical protein